jgi:hypothetical protein
MVFQLIRSVLSGARKAPSRIAGSFRQSRAGFTQGAEGQAVSSQVGRTAGSATNTVESVGRRVGGSVTQYVGMSAPTGIAALGLGAVVLYFGYSYLM